MACQVISHQAWLPNDKKTYQQPFRLRLLGSGAPGRLGRGIGPELAGYSTQEQRKLN